MTPFNSRRGASVVDGWFDLARLRNMRRAYRRLRVFVASLGRIRARYVPRAAYLGAERALVSRQNMERLMEDI